MGMNTAYITSNFELSDHDDGRTILELHDLDTDHDGDLILNDYQLEQLHYLLAGLMADKYLNQHNQRFKTP